MTVLPLRTQLPLKQGLRLFISAYDGFTVTLRTQLPLKQGLRLLNDIVIVPVVQAQNPTSTKTRIKTISRSFNYFILFRSEPNFH